MADMDAYAASALAMSRHYTDQKLSLQNALARIDELEKKNARLREERETLRKNFLTMKREKAKSENTPLSELLDVKDLNILSPSAACEIGFAVPKDISSSSRKQDPSASAGMKKSSVIHNPFTIPENQVKNEASTSKPNSSASVEPPDISGALAKNKVNPSASSVRKVNPSSSAKVVGNVSTASKVSVRDAAFAVDPSFATNVAECKQCKQLAYSETTNTCTACGFNLND